MYLAYIHAFDKEHKNLYKANKYISRAELYDDGTIHRTELGKFISMQSAFSGMSGITYSS
jgi:hypothetical protein